jgi:hypothetical protein
MPKCPICSHDCERYETLFTHLMQYHKKHDIVTALCKLLEKQEAADKFIEACEETEA